MSDTEVLPAKRVRKSTAKAEQAAASVEASKMSDSEDEIFLPTDSEDEVLLPINYESLLTKPSKKSALKAKKQPKKPQADGEAGPSRPKTKGKPKVAEPYKTCGRSPKKKARAGAATKKVKVVKDTTCVKACRKGPKSGCLTRQNGRGKSAGNLSCKEVDRRLKALGVDAAKASLCVKAAIMKGLIKITGEDKEELNKVIHSEAHEGCGHTIEATLGDLLEQPDYAGLDYEEGSMEATVVCKECDEDEQMRTYVTGICEGKPSFDCGKFHNHCRQCPGFGSCIHDYRNAHCNKCGKHYFRGLQGFPCDCRSKGRRGFRGLFGF